MPLRILDISTAVRFGNGVFRRHPRPIFAIGLLFGLGSLIASLIEDRSKGGSTGHALFGLALVSAVSYLVQATVQGMLVVAVTDDLAGKPVTVGSMARRVGPALSALFGAALLAALGVALGSVAFAIPGLIVAILWIFLAPIIVLEGTTGIAALRRSGEIVRGNWWRVFGLVLRAALPILVIALIVSLIFGAVLGLAGLIVVDVVAGAVLGPVVGLAVIAAYLQLADDAPVPLASEDPAGVTASADNPDPA